MGKSVYNERFEFRKYPINSILQTKRANQTPFTPPPRMNSGRMLPLDNEEKHVHDYFNDGRLF
jgi:hypothetical protein